MINFQQSVQPTAPARSEPMRAEFPSEAPQTKGKEIGKMLAAEAAPFGRWGTNPSRQKQISKDK